MKTNTIQKNIPKGWRQVALGDLVSIATGSRDANHGSLDGQYPFFTCAQKVSRINEFSFDTEAVLIAGNGDFNVKYYKGKFDAYQRTYVLSDFQNTMGTFIYQKAEQALNDIMRNNQGSSVKFIKMGDLTDYKFIIPPIREQQKIAKILGAVDEDIAKTREVIETTEKLKKGLMQQLFTRGIGHTKFKTLKLGDLCVFQTGKLNSNKAVEGGEYPFFTCSQETFAINQYSFNKKAILLAGNNATGKYSVKYYEGKFDAYQRTYVISIKNDDELSYPYLKEVLNTRLNELRDSSVGSTTKFLTLKLLEDLPISLPSISQQRKIAEILSAVDEKISINKNLKNKLTILKKGLMQDLLSGRVRVNY